MNVDGKPYRSIWLNPDDPSIVQTIDQRVLPHRFLIHDLKTWRDGRDAIADMVVRGAPLIGATAGWSLYLAALEARGVDDPGTFIENAAAKLVAARPTGANLSWAVQHVLKALEGISDAEQRIVITRREAESICAEDVETCQRIAGHGLELIRSISDRKAGEPVNILTHCNAGWLATVDWGTATAPIYLAHQQGIPVHVWVDETRPRNQGSQLTAWELGHAGVPHTVIVDNAGGHLMQHGQVDLCITGTDRTTRTGDVANKIGTYLKALAANDNDVPFYVAVPSASIDWRIADGLAEIPIEERDTAEVAIVQGLDDDQLRQVRTVPETSPIRNFGFDVTPARLITGLITDRGVCPASERGLFALFPERKAGE